MVVIHAGQKGKRFVILVGREGGGVLESTGEQVGLGDGPFWIEHRCGTCRAIRTVLDIRASLNTTVVYDGLDCPACERSRMLALNGSPECPTCARPETFKPSHMGSKGCQSGSLASGGVRSHCSCNACF